MHEELEAIDWILVVCAVTCVRYISQCYSQLRRHPRDKQEDSHAAASADRCPQRKPRRRRVSPTNRPKRVGPGLTCP